MHLRLSNINQLFYHIDIYCNNIKIKINITYFNIIGDIYFKISIDTNVAVLYLSVGSKRRIKLNKVINNWL